MNEEQLADLLAQHLDTVLEGGSLPETLPPEVADLLTVARSLGEAAPTPRPEFGLALKESLLGPTAGGNGAGPAAGSAFGGQTVSVVVVGLLVGAAVLALLVSVIILGVIGTNLSGSPTPAPLQTQIIPAQQTPSPPALTPAAEPTLNGPSTDSETTPTVTTTPVVDVLPVISVTIEIIIEPPALVPGSGGGGSGGGSSSGGGGGDDGDHNRGHGNDADHHDEDNPGKGGKD